MRASLLSLAAVAAASPLALRSEPAPLFTRDDAPAHVANTYIVKFKENSAMQVVHDAISQHLGGSQDHTVVEHVFQGFVANLDKLTLDLLRLLPDVEHIEQDSVGKISGQVVQTGSVWGLGRISHRDRGHNEYVYDDAAGAGTCVYVIDTGVEDTHPDFEGRAHQLRSYVSGSNHDDNGHGTNVAGIVGSKTYGVAKKTTIFGIKVADQNGAYQTSNVIAGLDFVASDSRNQNCPKGVAINLSLYGNRSDAFNNAVNNIVSKGFFVSACAGNENKDAGSFSPASASSACTVGGSDSDDKRYDESNFGPDVDIVAPAVYIESTSNNGGTVAYTGTSQAAPHIAGLAVYLASKGNGIAINNMCSAIVADATKNDIVNQSSGTVNLIAFNGGSAAAAPPPAAAPTTAAPAPKPTVATTPKPTPTTSSDKSTPTWWPSWFGGFW